jgi:hypothetical protein
MLSLTGIETGIPFIEFFKDVQPLSPGHNIALHGCRTELEKINKKGQFSLFKKTKENMYSLL